MKIPGEYNLRLDYFSRQVLNMIVKLKKLD